MNTEPLTGGCHCGAVRYEALAEPMYPGHCQCTNCRRLGGTGHASLFALPADTVRITGETRTYDYAADSGNTVTRHFCPTCGTGVYNTNSGMQGLITPFASTLDDPTRFQPGMVVFASSAVPWDHVEPGLHRFERMPFPAERIGG